MTDGGSAKGIEDSGEIEEGEEQRGSVEVEESDVEEVEIVKRAHKPKSKLRKPKKKVAVDTDESEGGNEPHKETKKSEFVKQASRLPTAAVRKMGNGDPLTFELLDLMRHHATPTQVHVPSSRPYPHTQGCILHVSTCKVTEDHECG
jgi:hypothetical protein